MAQTKPLSPTSLFSRIESLKKWQMEQQQRLLQQQSQQTKFLSNEHKRMYEALGIQQTEEKAIHDTDENNSSERNKHAFPSDHDSGSTSEYSDEEIEHNLYHSPVHRSQKDLDEIPIKSTMKDFTAILEEKLKESDIPVLNQHGKQKRKFLKKGAGLSRFRMTIQDLAHKKPKSKLLLNNRSIPESKQQPVEPKLRKETSKNFISKHSQSTNNSVKSHSSSKLNLIPKMEIKNASPSYDLNMEPLVLNNENLFISTKNSNFNTDNMMSNKAMSPNVKYSEPRATWTRIPEEKPTDYHTLLAELIEVRQRNPALFDSPMINRSAENDQQLFERELIDELKLFEALEQKASNSSFCSTSSLVTRLMDHPIKSTPKKQLNFTLLTSGIPEEEQVDEVKQLSSLPKRTVSFSDQAIQHKPSFQEETEEQLIISDNDSDSESSSNSYSSINSNDICDLNTIVPTKFQNHKPTTLGNKKSVKLFKDAATITDQPVVNSELLRTRLEQLETELATFRSENARVNRLKSQLETDTRSYEKRKRQLEKEVEEQKKQMIAKLDEERVKLAKDRSIYDRYIREIKEGKSARQKEREEINVLRSRLTAIEEEIKLKESKWGATQARIRSQLKHVEKENASLRTENNELRTKNGKLEATNKQLLSRRPSETKVLHAINKNLTKLAQETKEKAETIEKRKSLDKDKTENTRRRTRSQSTNRNSSPPKTFPENNEENKENSRNSLNSTSESKSSTERSFESVEREYEKLFGKSSLHEDNENAKLPAAEASSCSDMSGRREEIVLEDGSMRITYPNGNVRTISADGQLIVMQYHNGDLKETCKETGTIRYLYSDAKTWHTTFPDGMELLEFSNGQIEKRLSSGASEILFPNGCRRCTSPDGTEEVAFPDGTLLVTRTSSGERILTLPNGQREIHTRDHKRREYPDGTVKLLYPDGVQETRYANGRIRLKDKQGNLIMDSAAV